MIYTEQHLELQRTVKKFIDVEINPHIDEWERGKGMPWFRARCCR